MTDFTGSNGRSPADDECVERGATREKKLSDREHTPLAASCYLRSGIPLPQPLEPRSGSRDPRSQFQMRVAPGLKRCLSLRSGVEAVRVQLQGSMCIRLCWHQWHSVGVTSPLIPPTANSAHRNSDTYSFHLASTVPMVVAVKLSTCFHRVVNPSPTAPESFVSPLPCARLDLTRLTPQLGQTAEATKAV